MGEQLPPREVPAVDAARMKTMAALLADSNPIHWDAGAVRELGLGDRPVNQGPTNMAYVLDMVCGWAGGYDRLRRVRLRMTGNVFAGDRVRAVGEVTAVHDGLAECAVSLEVDGGGTALSGTVVVEVDG